MKLYFDIGDLCDKNELISRVDKDNYRYSPTVEKTIYMFVAYYAAHVLRNVITSGIGDNFITYTAPNPAFVMGQMAGIWSHENIIDMKLCFDTIEFGSVVRFSNIHDVLDHTLSRYGKRISEIRDTSKVTVECSDVGMSFVRLECN